MTKSLLSDKINFCLTKSTFVWQNQLLSDKCNFVVDKISFVIDKISFVIDKITFVRQKSLLLDKSDFCWTKFASVNKSVHATNGAPYGVALFSIMGETLIFYLILFYPTLVQSKLRERRTQNRYITHVVVTLWSAVAEKATSARRW